MSRRHITPKRLVDLWGLYAAFREPMIAKSTFVRDYEKIRRRIVKMQKEAPDLKGAIAIRDYLLKEYAISTAKKTIVQINACTQWAFESEILFSNPFEGLPKHLKVKKKEKKMVAFSINERDAIIDYFDKNESFQSCQWVKFLFWTGCRPEEAI